MDSKLLKVAAAVLAGAALVAPAWASPVGRSFNHTVVTGPHLKIGDKELDEGTYKFTATNDALTVESDGKVVAETSGRWVGIKDKAAYDSVIRYASGSIWQLRFRGEDRVFIVTTSNETVKSNVH